MPPIIENEYEGFDTAAVAAEIGESLFSKPTPDVPVVEKNALADDITGTAAPEVKPAVVVAPVVETPGTVNPDPNAPAVVPGQNSQAKALPKSWKKELAPEWEKASPALKDYVYTREADIMRGIQQYQQGYQAWDNLVKPFMPVLEANPDINPIALMQGLMATHLQLLSPQVPAAEKAQMATNLLKEYGITLNPAALPDGSAVLLDRLARAENRLANLDKEQKTWKQVTQQEGLTAKTKEVETFAADPKNEYFGEVSNDILRFIQNGAAADLPAAYELACWANPAVRAKMVAKQAQPAPATRQPRHKVNGQFVNLDGEEPAKRSVKAGTIEDTINGVVAKHYAKH